MFFTFPNKDSSRERHYINPCQYSNRLQQFRKSKKNAAILCLKEGDIFNEAI